MLFFAAAAAVVTSANISRNIQTTECRSELSPVFCSRSSIPWGRIQCRRLCQMIKSSHVNAQTLPKHWTYRVRMSLTIRSWRIFIEIKLQVVHFVFRALVVRKILWKKQKKMRWPLSVVINMFLHPCCYYSLDILFCSSACPLLPSYFWTCDATANNDTLRNCDGSTSQVVHLNLKHLCRVIVAYDALTFLMTEEWRKTSWHL